MTLSGPDEADVVLCTGLLNDEREQPDDYRDSLSALAARRGHPHPPTAMRGLKW